MQFREKMAMVLKTKSCMCLQAADEAAAFNPIADLHARGGGKGTIPEDFGHKLALNGIGPG